MLAQVSSYGSSRGKEAVTRFIMGAELSISFGKNLFFEDFMKTFVLNYQSLSRGTIISDILNLFNKKKLELQDEFRRGTFSIALNSNVWSRCAKRLY